jgi:hypothetical protein|tara:strand:- start:182 stop:493 length:312 start_codon:yes stop_codon:yes gene_type:complete
MPARLGSNVYTFTVGDSLNRDDIVDDSNELLNSIKSGTLKSVLPESYKTGDRLPKALSRKYYKSMSGFCDTPKEVVEGIKHSLCHMDDIMSKGSPQTVVSNAV